MTFLTGYRLLDMAWIGPGPFCAQLLGDLGFDVIKIGEVSKGAGRRGGRDMSPRMMFHEPTPQSRNLGQRNARSIAIDLKTDAGQEVFRRLVLQADALQEGFRPGVVERLGVGYEAVRAIKPDIVYASLTGYGQTGPYRDRVGHDLNYISIGGVIDMIGEAGGHPVLPATIFADFAAGGMSAAVHILAALLRREGTGKGAYADVSMTDAIVEINSLLIGGYLSSGLQPRRGETLTSGFWPWYNVYQTSDGRYVSIAAIEPWFYEALCRALDREDLIDQQWSLDHRKETLQEFKQLFRSRTRDEWMAVFEGVDACFAPVNSISEVVDDPHVRARRMVQEVDHPVYGMVLQVGSMLKLDGMTVEARCWNLGPGQDTDEILEEHGYSKREIADLRSNLVVA